MITVTKFLYILFGIFSIVGGYMGFVKAGSKASLIAGGICGLLLIVAAFLIQPHTNVALIIGLTASVAILGKFLPALIHHNFKPHVILSVVFAAASVVLTLLSWYRK